IGLISATVIALIPWVLQVVDQFDPLYFRIVAALTILATAAFLIALIMRGIAVGHHPELKASSPVKQPVPGGLLAIYITVGSIAALVWFIGFSGFLVSGIQSTNPHPQRTYEYNRYY